MRKNTTLIAVIILLIGTFAVYIPSTPVEAGSSGPDYPPPATGDWIISGDTSVWDETIIVNGSLIVSETGKLTLINCTLKINCTSDGQYSIRVDSNGVFYVYDSIITPYNINYEYRFVVYGKLWTNHSTIEYLWGLQDASLFQGGVQIYGVDVDVWLNDTKVWKSWANGIHAINAVGVNITNCNITDNARIEIYLQNSQYVNISHTRVTDYTDIRPGDGIHIDTASNVDIYDCVVAGNPASQMDIDNLSYSTIRYCNLSFGADLCPVGVAVDNSNTTLRIVWNNISEGFYLDNASPIIENNHFNEWRGISARSGSHLYLFNQSIENNIITGGVNIRDSNATIINNTFKNNHIDMRNSYAWIEDCYYPSFHLEASSPFIVNSTIRAGGGIWVRLDNDSHPFTLNCTVDNWDHIYTWDPLSNVTVQSYLHVRVLDSDGFTPLPNAWVNITDNGNPILSDQTDVNGEVQWIPVTNRTYLYDYWDPFHPFTNISYNETVVEVEKGALVFVDNPRTVGMDTNHWEIFQVDPKFNISLSLGWNLISLPLIQPDESLDKVLESIDGKWDYIMAYNATDPDHWKTNSTHKPDQLNDLKTLDHKMGFWINITEPNVNLTVKGCLPTSTSIPLYAGWNLVGYPSLNNSVTVADALWGTGADKVEVFDPVEPYRIREVGPTYVMKPEEGYWVHVPADSVWIVNW